MSNKDLRLQCDITSSNVTLGSGNKGTNKIVMRLVNTGDDSIQFSGRGAQGTLFLMYSVGTRATDFVATDEESSAVQIMPAAGWQQNPYKNLSGQVTWSYRLPQTVLSGKEETSLTITNFECNTDPGKAKLTVRVTVTGYDNFEKPFDIDKKTTDELQILYFRANPPQIITEKDRRDFVVEWNTIKAGTVKLYKADQLIATLKEGPGGFQNGERFSYPDQNLSLTFVYKLVALDATDPDKRQERQISVAVVEPGFRRVDGFRSRFGYPSVLCNMDDVKLYSIFVNQGKPCLCSSAYPVVVWEVETAEVPDNMATSPAAYLGNQLWLVGGSAADTTNFSNQVWLYSPESGAWTQQADVPWKPRMGHVCVVRENRVWILGGLDANGNALKEVWSSGVNGDWKQHAAAAWPARCMHAAILFNKKLWVYGGVTEPFGDPLDDMWTSSDGETWNSYTAIPRVDDKPAGKPLGCALQELKHELNLLGTFREGTITEAKRFILDEGQQTWSGSGIPEEKAWHRQGGNTFSLTSVQYKGLVFLRSLNYQVADNPTSLNLFVP
jgi:Galactose oxidase, central domain